jgi:hypothetical protein
MDNKKYLKHDIVCYENFISSEDAAKIIQYFDSKEKWTLVAFYNSYGMNLIEDDNELENFGLHKYYFRDLIEKIKSAVEESLDVEIRRVSTHAQKWIDKAYASYHSDNSDMEGNPSAWERSKFVSLLYLNDDFEGGELKFRDHDISVYPKPGLLTAFPGGFENIHSVERVSGNTRYTIGAFWDSVDSIYSDERMAEWEIEIAGVREQQAEMYERWEKGQE